MALSETYYAFAPEDEAILGQHDWYDDVDNARSDVVDAAEDSAKTYVVYEVTLRPMYRTCVNVMLEKV